MKLREKNHSFKNGFIPQINKHFLTSFETTLNHWKIQGWQIITLRIGNCAILIMIKLPLAVSFSGFILLKDKSLL